MGRGVIDDVGGLPSNKWRLRIGLVDSTRLRDLALELLSGKKVLASDDGVQVGLISCEPTRILIAIRDANPATRFQLHVPLEALSEDEIRHLEAPDSLGVARPLPDVWMKIETDATQTWELFNCRVPSVLTVVK